MDQDRENAPNCMKCRHHVITHDASFPYACNAMGFKSRRPPSREVLAASGAECLAFERRPAPADGAAGKG